MKVAGSASPACLIRMMSKDVFAKPETEVDNETLLMLCVFAHAGAPVASPVIPLYSLDL